jgi:hypothetical protein
MTRSKASSSYSVFSAYSVVNSYFASRIKEVRGCGDVPIEFFTAEYAEYAE